MTRTAVVPVAVAAVLAWTVACCVGSPNATPGARSTSDGSLLPANPTDPAATAGSPPSPTPPDQSSPVILDPSLLDALPADINGFAMTEAMDEAAVALNDPGLPRIASGLDTAVAVDPASANLVLAYVVRLRDDVFTDDDFRQWRDSFDEGACAAAGGVVGRAEATLAGRTVFVTSCVAGLRTYHVWIDGANLLISASSVGDGRFGEILMSTLRV